MKKIMFVCTGNTCRSAMCEYITKKIIKVNELKGFSICSRGLSVSETEINPKAKLTLKSMGIAVRKFLPKPVDAQTVLKQNFVICMTKAQKELFVGFVNIYTLDELVGCGEIQDPYGFEQEIYDMVGERLFKACKDFIINEVKK